MVSSAVYSSLIRCLAPSYYNARPIEKKEYCRLFMVSVLFIVNIVLGNASIKYCSLALDQVSSCFCLVNRLSDVQCQRGQLLSNTFFLEKSSRSASTWRFFPLSEEPWWCAKEKSLEVSPALLSSLWVASYRQSRESWPSFSSPQETNSVLSIFWRLCGWCHPLMVEQQFGCFGADPLGGYDGVRLFHLLFCRQGVDHLPVVRLQRIHSVRTKRIQLWSHQVDIASGHQHCWKYQTSVHDHHFGDCVQAAS